MTAIEEQPTVGLFGTCGDTTFRQELFIPEYERLGIRYFNPQVANWKPELALIEADHLANDTVQTWPVTGETYGGGSLAEQGYSIASSLRAESPLPKFIVPMIEQGLNDELMVDEVAAKESLRARKLAAAHMKLNASPNVFVVDSLEEMLDVSISLYKVSEKIVELSSGYNPAFKRFMGIRKKNEAVAAAMDSGNLGAAAVHLSSK